MRHNAPLARLIAIGIDAASPDLLEHWIADGALPNLARLVARGTSSRVRGVEGFFIGSTWPSMYTGTNPAEHGVHYLLELVRGTYELSDSVNAAFVRRPAFWRALSDAGKRVAILDVPLTRLEDELNGVQIVEWGGHDSVFGRSRNRLKLKFKADTELIPLVQRATPTIDSQPILLTLQVASNSVLHRRESCRAKYLRAEAGTSSCRCSRNRIVRDISAGICMTECIRHIQKQTTRQPAIQCGAYIAIDREIGALMEMEPNAHFVVFSAHSMKHWYGAQFLLQDILTKLGAVVVRPVPPPTLSARATSLLRVVRRMLPAPVRSAVKRARSAVVKSVHVVHKPSINADVLRSRCSIQPNGLAVGGVRLNLVGREPTGVLRAGAEADAFVDWLTSALEAVVDERTGVPLVKRVVRTASLYSGDNLDLLPDLLVEWNDVTAVGSTTVAGGVRSTVRATSPLIGVVEGANDFGRTGEHRSEGWMVAAGPGVECGTLDNTPALFDLAPTLCAMLGVALTNVSGQPINQLLPQSSSPHRG